MTGVSLGGHLAVATFAVANEHGPRLQHFFGIVNFDVKGVFSLRMNGQTFFLFCRARLAICHLSIGMDMSVMCYPRTGFFFLSAEIPLAFGRNCYSFFFFVVSLEH